MSRYWVLRITFALVAAVIGGIIHSPSLMAFSPAPPEPDPWFTVRVQIEARSLPQGVEFKRVHLFNEITGYFTNASSTPFYLVTTPSTPLRWVYDVPPTFIPKQMAVSGIAFRMNMTRTWSRTNFPGILVANFIKYPPGQATGILKMDAYLGDRKIAISGRFHRGQSNRVELDSPLQAPLRLVDVSRSHGRFAIVNDGSVPLYTGAVFSRPVGWVAEMPPGFLATHKIVAGKTYYGERLFPSTADGWKETHPHDARLTKRQIELYVPDFRFNQVYLDNRPDNVKVPNPQYFIMKALYGTQKVTIRGRVLYHLNRYYDPIAGQSHPQLIRKPRPFSPTY